jgi:hypothetical protein
MTINGIESYSAKTSIAHEFFGATNITEPPVDICKLPLTISNLIIIFYFYFKNPN